MYTWVSFLPSCLPALSGKACHYFTPGRSENISRGLGIALSPAADSSWFGLAQLCTEGELVCTVLSLPRNSHGIHPGAAQAAQLLCPQITECTVVCYTGCRLYNLSWCERNFCYSISAPFQCKPGDPQIKKWGTHPSHPIACSVHLHASSAVFGLVANVPSPLWTYGAYRGGRNLWREEKKPNMGN